MKAHLRAALGISLIALLILDSCYTPSKSMIAMDSADSNQNNAAPAKTFDIDLYWEYLGSLPVERFDLELIDDGVWDLVWRPGHWRSDSQGLTLRSDPEAEKERRLILFTGCNGVTAKVYSQGEALLKLILGPSTKVGGSEAAMRTEREYRTVLNDVIGYGFTSLGDELYLIYDVGGMFDYLVYQKRP